MRFTYTALITGATGGIGQELCREFARNGFNLIITARSQAALEELAARLRRAYGVKVLALAADLTRPEAPDSLHSQIGQMGVEVDVLVNNAGFGIGGGFSRNSPAAQEALLQVNVHAPTRLCRLFLPDMLSRGCGWILNIASTGSFVPGPMNSMYCASKAYVLSLSEALSQELQNTGVVVTAVCPGATHTGFAHRADMESTLLFNHMVMHPRQVAREAFDAMARGKAVHVVGWQNRLMIFATRLSPRKLNARVSQLMQTPGAKPWVK